jgi:flagellin
MNANRNFGTNVNALGKSMEKLSSGLRINRAGDDAAGLSISEKMRAQINGLDQASTNSEDAISMIQTAEGALNETHSILQRMRTLSVQAANGTSITEDKSAIQKEINELASELDRINTTTQFNKQYMFSNNTTVTFQVGANENETMSQTFQAVSSTALTVNNLNVTTESSAGTAISTIDEAIAAVSAQRSTLGAKQNRLEHTIANLDNASENLSSAESRIRDVDMASEMMKFSTSNILQQAAQSMLAQANQQPSQVLQLLQ